ncbi:MFS transporter [Amycolatopsis rhabdoformis]|uniref:MFS transporter n=1 Tax=Amycolatopsis rhabdoformis TaxID=1448059 RepID=A0ABZ1IGZ6_9PSEU|nr:MFS transporter [Amycolatopsis rhabdoformis]WSE33532.1 MFS transporter [Amycolatopsis rhabdoformis]
MTDDPAGTRQATPERPSTPTPAVSVALVVAIVLVATNLRATLTGVGPLLPQIEHDTGLSPTWGGLLTTLPLLTFALTSPLVGRVSHRIGTARLVVFALLLLVAGTVIRSLPGSGFLFVGTVALSAAIACGNVLLPSVIRRTVPANRIGAISGLYVAVMGVVAAVSSGVSVPLANTLPGSWHTALAWGLVFAVVALAVWIPRIRHDQPAPAGSTHARIPWRSGLAWQVSVFMGLQSLGFYTVLAWLPSILARQGTTAEAAGWILFYYQVIALIASSAAPLLTRGRSDQRWVAVSAALLVVAGFGVLLAAPSLALLSVTLLGLGGGTCLVLALGFQSQRAADHTQAAALAGMAQSIGYLIAAVGPLALGAIHDATGEWTLPLVVLGSLSLLLAIMGYGAGRDRFLPTAGAHPKS